MDLADLAEKETDNFFQNCVNNRRETDRLHYIGICYNCEERVDSKKVFCNAECADDYRRRQSGNSRH